MPLTRRRDATENLEQWSIYDEGVRVGLMRKVGATDGKTTWQWSCGMRALPHQPSGSAADFDEARAALQQAWDGIADQVTPAMRDEWLYQQAFTEEICHARRRLQDADAKPGWLVALLLRRPDHHRQRSGSRPGIAHGLNAKKPRHPEG